MAVINKKLQRLPLEIVPLQETRLPGFGSIRDKDFTFFWQGQSEEEQTEHCVGFAIRNSLLGSIVPLKMGSEQVLSMQLYTTAGLVSIISAYAPTLTSTAKAKDNFYNDLNNVVNRVLANKPLFILGDFNASGH